MCKRPVFLLFLTFHLENATIQPRLQLEKGRNLRSFQDKQAIAPPQFLALTFLVMHFVYVIYNLHTDKYYIGQTSDINQRIESHKNGENIATKHKSNDWRLVYCEIYKSKKDALIRENKLKRHGSGLVEIKKRTQDSIELVKNNK